MRGIAGTITEYRTPDQVEMLDKPVNQTIRRNEQARLERLYAQRDDINKQIRVIEERVDL